MTEGAVEAEVGRARLRKEDARLLTGQTHWTDNIQAAGMLHLAILRSPMAHARLERVDVSPPWNSRAWWPRSREAISRRGWDRCRARGR